MLLKLNIQLNHVINAIFDKIRENNICLIAGRQSISGPRQQIPGFIHIQFRPDAQAESGQFLWMVTRIILYFGKYLAKYLEMVDMGYQASSVKKKRQINSST